MNSKRLDEILGGSPDDFNARWNETAPADDISVLPAGKYKALVVNGGLAESNRRRTPSYKVVFQVLTPPTFSNRKIFHDFWLSAAALPYAKRELEKLGITAVRDLERPPATGIVVELNLAVDTADDGTERNKVIKFSVIARAPSVNGLAPSPPDDGDDTEIPF